MLRIYDYLHRHKAFLWVLLVFTTLFFASMASSLSYREDIADFLPLESEERQTMDIYRDISGADRMVVIFDNGGNADSTIQAIDLFVREVQERDSMGWSSGMLAAIDAERQVMLMDFVYDNVPYFLTEEDYVRMDSCLSCPDFIPKRLQEVQEMLMLPMGSLVADNMVRDPLGLYLPVMQDLQGSAMESKFSLYDGYIFTTDMKHALVLVSSPFGHSETAQNGEFLHLLQTSINEVNTAFPNISARLLGGPQIAVGNADRIRQDSILAISLSLLLVFALLGYAFRSIRNIALVCLSVLWGGLFALGCMSLFRESVSVIVLGISSIIIGIAINYPLHVIAHTAHQRDIRSAMRELASPLIIGNITTVGAFMALLPLQSTALRDLGLFASLLLVGTIIFVILFLPHMLSVVPEENGNQQNGLLERLTKFRPEKNRFIVLAVLLLTPVFAWFSQYASFDSNIANLNYMTPEQKEDMAFFSNLMVRDTTLQASEECIPGTRTMYFPTSHNTLSEALEKSHAMQPQLDSLARLGMLSTSTAFVRFIPSLTEQKSRLDMWHSLVDKHGEILTEHLPCHLAAAGFEAEYFAPYFASLVQRYGIQDLVFFNPLITSLFQSNFSTDSISGRYTVVRHMQVHEACVEEVRQALPSVFDSTSMNKSLADSLSDNFNYIGWICSLIVFLFLWASFRNLRVALLCFLPMAVSWVWILGIMGMCGIEFNLINIILATFIFGQGDDYTIFMVEGCLWERRHGRPMLHSYKRGIILSALIMFAGIGTLIFARHPALYSLAEVTIIGMASVVLMAWLMPPLLFQLKDMLDEYKYGNKYKE